MRIPAIRARALSFGPRVFSRNISLFRPPWGYASEEEAIEMREFFATSLYQFSSKREAKVYLETFGRSLKRALMMPEPVNFEREPSDQGFSINYPIGQEEFHINIVKIRLTTDTDDALLKRVGKTLRYLTTLGPQAIVVLETSNLDGAQQRQQVRDQADRVVENLESAKVEARRVDGTMVIDADGSISCSFRKGILAPLSRGLIPVIPPLAVDSSQTTKQVSANSILLALTRAFAKQPDPEDDIATNVGRIFILDPLGGIPSTKSRRAGGTHVFLNLQQEYDQVGEELQTDNSIGNAIHLSNLTTLRDCLGLLPPTSSGLITTLAAAAIGTSSPPRSKVSYRNPLLFTLINDKPIFSSSAPVHARRANSTTFLKNGMPLLTIPPSSFSGGFRLSNHPAVNMDKLVRLVEDSFLKKLDVGHYLNRVDQRIACVLIAGDYKGAAIITWEDGDGRKIPYLDKLVVAQKSQGVGGVADVVFQGMLNVFPDELLWRSRNNNVVNKWYHERSQGSYMVDEKWKAFWTTEGVKMSTLSEYLKICSRIEPSLRE